jgi:fluoroacetyl-CoA thioesterase
MRDIPIGLTHTKTLIVGAGLTVPQVSPAFDFADMPEVFATAFLVAFLEATCLEAVKPYLGPDQRTVGTHVDVSHVAATPVGMAVTCTAEVVLVEGRRLRFRVSCRDERDLIGEGFHERAVIELPKFVARVAAKVSRPTA